MRLITASAAADGFFGAIGYGITTLAAVTAGVASVPTPLTEGDWDGWLHHQFFDCHLGLAGSADGAGYQRVEIDSKAMRKIPDADYIPFAVVEFVEAGTASLEFNLGTRMLVALP